MTAFLTISEKLLKLCYDDDDNFTERRNAMSAKTDTTNVAGRRRAAHFAGGGDVARWRGRASVVQSKKHVANKKACRKGNWD